MEVILLERIQNLGDLGDLVEVKSGYGRNYLVPQGKAVYATSDAKEKVEAARAKLAKQEAKRVEVAEAKMALAVKSVSISRLANEEGHLFGSVSNIDIAEAMTAEGTEIERSEVYLAEGPFKMTGEFEVEVILHPDVRFTVEVIVLAEEGEVPEGMEIAAELVNDEPIPDAVDMDIEDITEADEEAEEVVSDKD